MSYHHAFRRTLVDQLLVLLLVALTIGVAFACIAGVSTLAEDPCAVCR